METLLAQQAFRARRAEQRCRVLLTTAAGEQHTLGIAMVNAVLNQAGVGSVNLPGALPLPEIVKAAAAYRVEVVGISASCHSAPRLLGAFINTLRNALPKRVELWCGGAGMRKILHIPPGVTVIDNLDQLKEVCGTTFARP